MAPVTLTTWSEGRDPSECGIAINGNADHRRGPRDRHDAGGSRGSRHPWRSVRPLAGRAARLAVPVVA